MLAAIPARHGSTRFPGKPLAEIDGRPMIARVAEAAGAARTVDAVVVVTDTEAIGRAGEAGGARSVVIDRPAASGTDRIAHLLEADPDAARAEVIVNVQGDEPLIEPEAIDAAVDALERAPRADVATLVRPARGGEDPADPNLVKVAVTASGRALYFSRSPIPHSAPNAIHVGLYAFRRAAFDRFVSLDPTPLERTERLEQLRALEDGMTIHCVVFETESIGVDTPEDLGRVESILRSRSRGGAREAET